MRYQDGSRCDVYTKDSKVFRQSIGTYKQIERGIREDEDAQKYRLSTAKAEMKLISTTGGELARCEPF